MTKARRGALLAVVSALTPMSVATAAAPAPHLFGASALHALEQVTYRATGLRTADGYALRLIAKVRVNGRTVRCVAYMAAPRAASGTELFKGSVPNRLTCPPTTSAPFPQITLLPGRYVAEVCVPVSQRAGCQTTASIARRPVRVA